MSAPPAMAALTDCAHPQGTPLYGGLLEECARCGLVRTAEVPQAAYTAAYFTADGAGGGYDFDSPFARAYDAARFAAELDRLAAAGLHGTLLDIGCATGSFLHLAQQRGWRVAGVEVSDFAREHAQSRLGSPVVADLAALPPGARYDVVTLHHVLEHVHQPGAFLRTAVRPRVGRLLLVEVPNFASLASHVHGPSWRDLRPDQHVQHFRVDTLRRLLCESGFEVTALYTLWQPLWSLRTAWETARLLPHVRRALPRERRLAGPPAAAEGAHYREPRGLRRLGAAAARWLLAPAVRRLERAGRGERLVAEARPLDAVDGGAGGGDGARADAGVARRADR